MNGRFQHIAKGMAEHAIQLLPPLPEESVSAFESQHGIQLPDDFRRFITEVGNGDIGPGHWAFLPLGQNPNTDNEYHNQYWHELPNVRLPFPFTQRCNWDEGETSEEGTLEQSQNGCLLLRNYAQGDRLCSGEYWVLIVNGPECGNVWFMDLGTIGPHAPKRDFLSWCEKEITIFG